MTNVVQKWVLYYSHFPVHILTKSHRLSPQILSSHCLAKILILFPFSVCFLLMNFGTSAWNPIFLAKKQATLKSHFTYSRPCISPSISDPAVICSMSFSNSKAIFNSTSSSIMEMLNNQRPIMAIATCLYAPVDFAEVASGFFLF